MSRQLSRPRWLFIGLSLIVLVGWRGPAWMNISENGALLGDNIVRSWLLQTTRSRLFQGASSDWVSEVQLRQRDGKGHGWLRAYSEGKITLIPGLRALDSRKVMSQNLRMSSAFVGGLAYPMTDQFMSCIFFRECTFLRIRASQDRTSDFSTHSRAHLAAGADL